ncbi:hypothetical protein N9W84_01075 [bacterium]|nr:hypothetical protein [bacterium]
MKPHLTDWLELGDCWYKYIKNHSSRHSDCIVGFISGNEEDGYDVFIWPKTISSNGPIKNIKDSDEARVLNIKSLSTVESAFLKGNLKLSSIGYFVKNILL